MKESVGIATGILITALHNAGLATLTHTPSPMGFLNEVLNRPSNEKAFFIVGLWVPKKKCGGSGPTKKILGRNKDHYLNNNASFI